MIIAAASVGLAQVWPWALAAAVLLAGWRFRISGGGGTAIESLETANRVLERRVKELEVEDHRKTKRIAELEARTDVALAIVPVLDALVTHELHASVRSDKTLDLLDLIAKRLGPEPPE